jgi:hypothetical protein
MSLLDFFNFKKNKLSQLEKMSIAEFEKERIRLEAQQDSLISKVKTLEKRKEAILKEGAKKGDLERKTLAVRYKQVDSEAAGYQHQVALMSRQIQIVGKLEMMKRREESLKQEGLWSTIAEVPTAEIEDFMISMRTKAKEGDLKASRLLEILNEPLGTEEMVEDDKEIQDVLAAMEELGETSVSDTDIEKIKQKHLEKEVEAEEDF